MVSPEAGLAAWQWQLEGATIKGNLRLHLVFALTTATIILALCWTRARLPQGRATRPGLLHVVLCLSLTT